MDEQDDTAVDTHGEPDVGDGQPTIYLYGRQYTGDFMG